MVGGSQDRLFGCSRSLSRCQKKKNCCRQEEGTTQGKRLPSDGAFKKAKASCVPSPQNLPRFAIGPGFGPPPQSALNCLASFQTRTATHPLNAFPRLSPPFYIVCARRQQKCAKKWKKPGCITGQPALRFPLGHSCRVAIVRLLRAEGMK